MRELTKSIASFSWALSLFGIKQLSNLMRSGDAAGAFDSVTQAAAKELGDTFKATFELGDRIQKGVVDVTFGLVGLGPRGGGARPLAQGGSVGNVQGGMVAPGRSSAEQAGLGWRTVAGQDAPGAAAAPVSFQAKVSGWGPVPPGRI